VPSRPEHVARAESNQRLSIALSAGPNLDWSVTILFYAALHLVEATLAPHSYSVNHVARFANIRSHQLLRPIFFHYRELYNVSLRSRYEYEVFAVSFAQNLSAAHYEPIERHLQPLLGFTF
jgi:hypothetical protein